MIINSVKPYSSQQFLPTCGREVSFSGKFGVNIGTEYTISCRSYKFDKKLDPVFEKKLFPNGIENLEFAQRAMDSCASLAILKSLSLNKTGQELLRRMVQVKPNGKIQVSFPNYPKLKLFPGKIDNARKDYNARGDLGVAVFEEAYKNLRKNTIIHNSLLLLNKGSITDKSVINLGVPDFMALKDFTGVKTFKTDFLVEPNYKIHLNKLSDNPHKFVTVASTRPFIHYVDDIRGFSKNGEDAFLQVLPEHSYSIVDVNSKKRELTIVNPYDSNIRATIGYEKFHRLFDHISSVDMDKVAKKFKL